MTTRLTLTRLVLTMLIAPLLAIIASTTVAVSPASAADGCGSGWHKQSYGKLDYYAPKSSTRYGRTVTAGTQGFVMYCTRGRSGRPDQRNQSIHIGVPEPAISGAIVKGKTRSHCMQQTVTVRVLNETARTFSVTGAASGPGGGASVTFTDRDVTIAQPVKCFSALTKATQSFTGLKIVAPNQRNCLPSSSGTVMWHYCTSLAPRVEKVTIHTRVVAVFRRNGVNEEVDVNHYETDLA